MIPLYFRCGVPYSCCHAQPDGSLVNLMCGFEVQALKDTADVSLSIVYHKPV